MLLVSGVVVAHSLGVSDDCGVVTRDLQVLGESMGHSGDGTTRRVHSPSKATNSRVVSVTAVFGSIKASTPRRLWAN